MCDGGLFHAAAISARELLRRADIPVYKALDPLRDEDFITIVMRLVRALQAATSEDEAEALREALDELDVDWSRLTPEARDRVFDASKAAVAAVAAKVLPKVRRVFSASARSLIAGTKASVKLRYSLNLADVFSTPDRETRDALLRIHSMYVKDEFGKRADAFDARARSVVADGLLKGLGPDDITQQLRADLTLAQLNRSEAYWGLISTTFGNRARTSTQLNSFEEAGITIYKFVAVMDERTTDICRYMDGRSFSVAHALERQRSIESLDDPEEIRDRMPWVRRGTAPSGEPYMYYERGGQRHAVAYINESAVGRVDQRGVFSRGLSDQELERAGLAVPPLHAYCRSTIVTEEG